FNGRPEVRHSRLRRSETRIEDLSQGAIRLRCNLAINNKAAGMKTGGCESVSATTLFQPFLFEFEIGNAIGDRPQIRTKPFDLSGDLITPRDIFFALEVFETQIFLASQFIELSL